MAYCPKCKGEMGERSVVCPHCGYDFPPEPDPVLKRTGIAYSSWADVGADASARSSPAFSAWAPRSAR